MAKRSTELEVLYAITARALIWRGTYDGPMTEAGMRGLLEEHAESFDIEWEITEVRDESGRIVAASHKES